MTWLLLVLAATATSPASLGALEPMRPWVGRCCFADMPDGATDRHCFSAMYGGKHIRDRHVVTQRGAAVYAGESLYSAEGGAVGFIYLNSLGGVGRGSAKAEGDALSFSLIMRATPDGTPRTYLTRWTRTADGYEAATDGEVRRFRADGAAPDS